MHVKLLDDLLIPNPSNQTLVEGFRLSITRGDLQTLNGLNWLNDEVCCNVFSFNVLYGFFSESITYFQT